MDEVVFGRPAFEAIVEQINRRGTQRAFLMASGPSTAKPTSSRTTAAQSGRAASARLTRCRRARARPAGVREILDMAA